MQRAIFRRFSPRSLAIGVGMVTTASAGSLLFALENALTVEGAKKIVHPVKLPFQQSFLIGSFDYASVRRGYEVYKQVCSACHSLELVHYRQFVDVFMTEAEAKADAAEALISDTDDQGVAITRPGRLPDPLPKPYPNDKAAAAANNGSVPPDLSLISLARHGGDDYIFSLLTGYFDPPAGVKVDEGKAYNPYFSGGVIAMPQQLFDEGIEYSDGTVATQSQQAKDVASFLHWCGETYHDARKKVAIKIGLFLILMTPVLLYGKRYVWSFYKTQKFQFYSVKGREAPKKRPS